MTLRPLSFGQDAAWLSVLADVERPRDLGSLPTDDVVQSSLEQIAAAVKDSPTARRRALHGSTTATDIWGNTGMSICVPAYEKKLMMDQALSGNRAYFQDFYSGSGCTSFLLDRQQSVADPHQRQRIRIRGRKQCVGEVGGEADPVLLRREGHAKRGEGGTACALGRIPRTVPQILP